MDKKIHNMKVTRQFLVQMLENYTLEQWNKIPEGFNNNMIWNLSHMVAAQQGLIYIRSGKKPVVAETFMNEFRSGTRPERTYNAEEIEEMKNIFIQSVDQMAEALTQGGFDTYDGFTTRFGVEIKSVEDALEFILFHEGTHTGIIMAMRKIV